MAELHLVRVHDPARPEQLRVVKRLHRRLAVDREAIAMFLDEARIASTLHHPNVVQVHEIGDSAEQCFIVMEYLHGHDLRDTLGRMAAWGIAMQPDQALAIARAVAAGLHYTHERTGPDGELLGIVHRDVSPHNVLLTYDGQVKVVDFGIAKASTQSSRTRTGALKGKVAYMAPEHAMAQPLDRRSDVFCIGILLWEMTTGRSLYRRDSELATLKAVTEVDAPRPSRVIAKYPRDLEKLVMKTLARSPAERWATAAELIDAIDELARRRRWSLGPPTITGLMARVFSDELALWQLAQARGISLGDHLVAQGDAGAVTRGDHEDLTPPTTLAPPRLRDRLVRRRWPWIALAAGGAFAGGAWIASAVVGHGATSPPDARSVVAPPPPSAPAPPPSAAVPPPPTAATTPSLPRAAPSPLPGSSRDPASPQPEAIAPGAPAPLDPRAQDAPQRVPPGRPAPGRHSPTRPVPARPRSPEAATTTEAPARAPAGKHTRPTTDELDRLPP